MKQFRVAFFLHNRIATLTEPLDLIEGLAIERAFLAKNFPARLMTESRALRKLHAELAVEGHSGEATVAWTPNAAASANSVVITTEQGALATLEPRDLAGPTADEIADHTPAPRAGKDGDACGD